jgi:hypothetical protein
MTLFGGDLHMTDPAIRIRTGLQNLLNPCTTTSFAAIAVPPMVPEKYSQQILGQILNGQREFKTTEEANNFVRVVATLEHIQNTVEWPIDWSNTLLVKDKIIQTFREIKNTEDPIHRQVWVVRLSLHNYFQKLRTNGSVITTLNYYNSDAAVFTDHKLAGECVERLKQLNVPAKAEFFTVERRQSTITTSLEEIGFTQDIAVASK